ncbi:MAG: hypothetical protein ABI821_15970 [Pseudomonadota bacterium]
MPDRRKPPFEKSSRHEGAPLPSDSGGFSIETTTMRLKSLTLRRSESVKAAVEPKSPGEDADDMRRGGGPSGRVRHDERGMAVWDWAVATGEFATLSATRAMKKLSLEDLQIEEPTPSKLKVAPQGRDVGGGGDPYNQRGSGQRPGEAGKRQGVTGSADRAAVLDQLLGKKK